MEKDQIAKEVEEVAKLPIVQKILELIATTTGMRFVAMAKVTPSKWVALSVLDKLGYGVQPGDELELFDTLCSEVREFEKPVVIDYVDRDEHYKDHAIPKTFGFQSHISVPIIRGDENFYGTLCAVDPEPNDLKNEKTLSLFAFFADLISDHLEIVDLLKSSNKDLKNQVKISNTLEGIIHSRTSDLKKNVRELARSNQELKEFSSIASHDLQEPLRKIQTYISFIEQNESTGLTEKAQAYFARIQHAAERMRSLINDLLAYSVAQNVPSHFETVNLGSIISDVTETLSEEIGSKNATLRIGDLCDVTVFPYQIRQLFQNLIGNSLKYSSQDRPPVIEIYSAKILGKDIDPDFDPDRMYCRITIKDNGIGFDQQYASKIFKVFERLHGKTDYSGTGIGLAIVRKIVENHEGFISGKGELGVGAEFNVFLPLDFKA
ncbi:GAF domain-containing protein [Flavobacterium sp. MAH-1]|uniref:histidine kinase n=1 Tax=Flavobacterium agri TaxID=2743471 RepID=A0A7Y9C5K0_9FLAO|nr:ATP-binding protein [Flavobacterium agri]NUY80464.1 GAF domain-containing protein [Flavobacterium agri]NYA70489.1 GAF domain-containing protein [Flavobacterium agri]